MSRIDRQRGALLGLAVGDALGAAVEFKPRGTFPPVTGYREGGPHRIDAGDWTDDTSMALALADSIGSVGWDLNDQAQRYLNWRDNGVYSVTGTCFDIGMTTDTALTSFQRDGDALTSGETDEFASGNGSIMRLAPVPIAYLDLFPDQLAEFSTKAAESSLTTHASPQCVSACRYMAVLLAGLMIGDDKEAVLDPEYAPVAELRSIEPLHPLIEEISRGAYRSKSEDEIVGSGWVVKSLEAAIWCFDQGDDFEEAVLSAVNLGNDADTTGAVCGQLAGAYWGESGIPEELLDGLGRPEMLEAALEAVLESTA